MATSFKTWQINLFDQSVFIEDQDTLKHSEPKQDELNQRLTQQEIEVFPSQNPTLHEIPKLRPMFSSKSMILDQTLLQEIHLNNFNMTSPDLKRGRVAFLSLAI